MAEKTFEAPKRERFEFVLTVNGNIVCQRYFKINNFQEKALGSVYLTEALWDCQRMIDNDLKDKSLIYLNLTAPQVFQNREEMNKWVETQPFKLDVATYVVLRDEEDVFVWNGNTMVPYTKPFNRNDYVGEKNDTPCVLKLSFLDNGEEVRSISWDGNVYPRFVRTNIDITNSRNKYNTEDNASYYEAFIINEFNKDRNDLSPLIMRRIGYACNGENTHYFTKVRYGKTEYDIYQKGYNERLFLNMNRRSK